MSISAIPTVTAVAEVDETRRRLLDAAIGLFADVGFDGASVRQICDRAGVKNIGAINYHFQSKERLYAEAVKEALCHNSDATPFPAWGPNAPATQKLREFVHTIMIRMLDNKHPAAMQLVMREFSRPTLALDEAIRQNIKPMADLLHGILADLLPKMPFEERVLIGFSIIGQCLYYHQNRLVSEVLFGKEALAHLTAERIAKHVADFTLSALGFRPPFTAPKSGGKR